MADQDMEVEEIAYRMANERRRRENGEQEERQERQEDGQERQERQEERREERREERQAREAREAREGSGGDEPGAPPAVQPGAARGDESPTAPPPEVPPPPLAATEPAVTGPAAEDDDLWHEEGDEAGARSGMLREARALFLPAVVRQGLERMLCFVPPELRQGAPAAWPRTEVEMTVEAAALDLGAAVRELEVAVREAGQETLEGEEMAALGEVARLLPEWQALRDAGGAAWHGPEGKAAEEADEPTWTSGGAGMLRAAAAIHLPPRVRRQLEGLLDRLEEAEGLLDDAVDEFPGSLAFALARAAAEDLRWTVAILDGLLSDRERAPEDPVAAELARRTGEELPALRHLATRLAAAVDLPPEEGTGRHR